MSRRKRRSNGSFSVAGTGSPVAAHGWTMLALDRALGADAARDGADLGGDGKAIDRDQRQPLRDPRARLGIGLDRDGTPLRRIGQRQDQRKFGRRAHAAAPSSRSATISVGHRRRCQCRAQFRDLGHDMRQPRRIGLVAAPQVADQRGAQFLRPVGSAIDAEPSAERADHPPDLFADDHVAKADLAHLAVHVGHEQFGQLDPGARLRGVFVDAVEDERQHQADHVETAVERVGDAARRIPVRRARGRDNGVPQRTARLARVGLRAEKIAEREHAPRLGAIGAAEKGRWCAAPVSFWQASPRHKQLVRRVRLRLRGARASADRWQRPRQAQRRL